MISLFIDERIDITFYIAFVNSNLQYLMCIWDAACNYRVNGCQVYQSKELKALLQLPKRFFN